MYKIIIYKKKTNTPDCYNLMKLFGTTETLKQRFSEKKTKKTEFTSECLELYKLYESKPSEGYGDF